MEKIIISDTDWGKIREGIIDHYEMHHDNNFDYSYDGENYYLDLDVRVDSKNVDLGGDGYFTPHEWEVVYDIYVYDYSCVDSEDPEIHYEIEGFYPGYFNE